MQSIFIFYYNLTEAPILLLFICRKWQTIALSVSSLWSDIRFEPARMDHIIPSIEKTMHLPIMCLSWSQLEFAARRAGVGSARLTCRLSWMEKNIEAYFWLSKMCRYLKIQQDHVPAEAFANSFRNLTNLEELFIDNTTFHTSPGLKRFWTNLVVWSPRLTVLETVGEFPEDIFKHPALLGRLRKLSLDTLSSSTQVNQDDSFKFLKNLEELTWPFDTPPGLKHIASNLRALSIRACKSFRTISLPSLTTLNLRCMPDFPADSESLTLPALRHLTFFGPWKWLADLQAPKLYSLNIDDWGLWKTNDPMQVVRVRPISLTFTSRISDHDLAQLLATVWSNLTELHRVYRPFGTEVLSPVLFNGLTGTEDGDYLCPQLQCFTMKTRNPAHSTKSVKDQVETQVRRIIQARRGRGNILRRVCLIWDEYPERRATEFPCRDLGEDGITLL